MEVYIRVGNESVIAPNYIVNQLILKGTNQSFDTLTTNTAKKDYSFTLLEATYLERTVLRFEPSDYFSFGLADKNGFLTNAGKLPGYLETYKPEFFSTATDFRVILKNVNHNLEDDIHQVTELSTVSKQILTFCTTPKSKKVLAAFSASKI